MSKKTYKYEFDYFENVNGKELKKGYVTLDHDDIYEADDIFKQYHPDAVVVMCCIEGDINE